jgi:hypothetical protein
MYNDLMIKLTLTAVNGGKSSIYNKVLVNIVAGDFRKAESSGLKLATAFSYFMVPRPPPTPAPPLVGEPIVQGYNIKTHNFYEIKVDF